MKAKTKESVISSKFAEISLEFGNLYSIALKLWELVCSNVLVCSMYW